MKYIIEETEINHTMILIQLVRFKYVKWESMLEGINASELKGFVSWDQNNI